jgi:hypothetical protein
MTAKPLNPYEYREEHADDDDNLYIYLWVRERDPSDPPATSSVAFEPFKVIWKKAATGLNMVALATDPGNGKNTGDFVFRQLPAKTRRTAAADWITKGEGKEWAKKPAQLIEILVNGH